MALVEDVPATQQAISRQIGLLISKFSPWSNLHHAKRILMNLRTSLMETAAHRDTTVRTMLWISKALILRLHDVKDVLELLLDLTADVSHGAVVSRGLGLLLAPDEIFSKENGASIRLLAKQKVFNFCIPRIARDFRGSDNAVKPNLLVALSGLLKYMPTQVIMQEIDILLPLLLQSLELEDADVKAATIYSLSVISRESPTAIEGHMGSMVSRLLKSSVRSAANGPTVRLNALRCLKAFPGKVKDATLLPYRNTVTRGLMTALDDPKRDVRTEAVDCRAAWLGMDEPDSD